MVRMFGCCRSALVVLALLPFCCRAQSEWFSKGQVITSPGSVFQPNQAPATNPNQQRYSVSGTVVNSVTGEPIRRAVVRIQGAETHVTFTGEDGRFQLDGIPEGVYSPTANRPGFQFRGGPTVTVGSATPPVTLKLDPQCSVQGHIVDENGEPLENVFVHLTQFQIVNGRKREFGAMGANTDDNGDFEIDSIPPGKYLIRTHQLPIHSLAARRSPVQQVYPARFFPDASDEATAQVISLRGGEALRADFKLSPVQAFRVTGTVGQVEGYPAITVEDANGRQADINGGFGPRQQMFRLLLPNGSWTVVVTSRDQQGNVSVARIPVNVANAEVSGLSAALQPVPSIPVHIAAEESPENPGMQLKLVSRDGNATEYYARFDARDQAAPWAFTGVEPGSYTLYITSNANNCVESVQSGSTDLSRNDLVVTAGSGSAPIEITTRKDCGSITLSAPAEQSQSSYNIILASDTPAFEPRLYTVQPGQKFIIGGLTPGDYKIYTVDDASDLEYANPEALRNLSAQDIQLDSNGKVEFAIASRETARVN